MADLKITNPRVVGKLKLPAESASKALQISASGELESSTVTIAELANVAGLTSAAVSVDGTQTLTNKTLTSPVVNSPTGIVKADVGLSNVDNTSDANKPVSSDQQTALNLKANIASPTFTGTVSGITSTMVGLGNVDNTSDANKPVSTAQGIAIGLKISSTEKGAALGVATLDSSSLIPITQIPPAALERLVIVADQAARFALTLSTVQNGDTVKQTDTDVMYFVKDDANLDSAAGYETYSAGTAASVAWGGITGIPSPVSSLSGTNTGDQTATTVANTPAGSIAAITVQAAINELDTEKAPIASPTFTGTVSGISATMVGLGNVDNVQQLPMSYLDTDVTLAANSDVKVASQKAIKAYANSLIGASSVAGDISHTSFAAANNVSAAASVTAFAFAAGTVRSFKAQVSVSIDATTDLNEVFDLLGVQLAGGFVMSSSSVGDDSGVVFSITSAGQVQYTSANSAGFVSNTIKFRATATNV